jgi:hypothetical protein
MQTKANGEVTVEELNELLSNTENTESSAAFGVGPRAWAACGVGPRTWAACGVGPRSWEE